MNDSASGLAKALLQVISRDFSKFSPVTFGRMPMPQDDLTIMRLAQHGYPIIVSPIPPSCHPLFAPAISPG
jgi:hypothetical protein